MKLYELLEKNQKDKRRNRHELGTSYFLDNRHLLEKYPSLLPFYSANNDFDIIRANILIQAIVNKDIIEETLDTMTKNGKEINIDTIQDCFIDLPYLVDNNIKVYIPIFSRALNAIYRLEPEKLSLFPYNELKKDISSSIIDAFETYGYDLYDSYFTSLVKIRGDEHSMAFYDVDFKTIYIINDQGRLDVKIALFDKWLKRPVYAHIIDRITPVIDEFYNNDKTKFLDELLKNNLISYKLFHKYYKKEKRLQKKLEKKARKCN